MPVIQPASSGQIKLLRKLSMRKHRYRERLWIAEGMRTVEQILSRRGDLVLQIYLDTNLPEPPSFIPSSADIRSLEPDLLEALSDTDTPQGILALCAMPEDAKRQNLAENGKGVIVALDAIQDPGNLGTIIRTASWFEAAAIVAGTGTADPYHPKTVRSTAGATGATPLVSGDLAEILSFYSARGWDVILLDSANDSIPLRETVKKERQILVLGNEGNGISRKVRELGFPSVEIPGNSTNVESLNVAMACGIALYHFS